jgi:hypothetical protein
MLLVVAATVVVFSTAVTPPAHSMGAPEQTLNNWLNAVERGDYRSADLYLTSRMLNSGDDSETLAGDLGLAPALSGMPQPTITVGGVTVNGDRAIGRLNVGFSMQGITASLTVTAILVNENGVWKIDSMSPNF